MNFNFEVVHTIHLSISPALQLPPNTPRAVRDLRVREEGDHEPKGRRAEASKLVAPGGATDARHGLRGSAARLLQGLLEKRPSYGGGAGVRGGVPSDRFACSVFLAVFLYGSGSRFGDVW